MTLKTFWRRHWDEGVVYVLALGAAVVSNNLEAFKGKEAIRLDFSLGRLGIAAFLSLVMMFLMELVPLQLEEEAKEAAHKGKQKRTNLARRFLAACIFGFASPYLVDGLIKLLVGKVGA
jgi:hypothetical protein